jgi:hypothetical protein
VREFAAMAVIFTLAFYVTITVHEAGHLLAGLSVGYDFSIFAVGALNLTRADGKWRVAIGNPAWVPKSFMGFTLFFINDYTEFRRRMMIYIGGGPLANFLLLVVAYLALRASNFTMSASLFATAPLTWVLGTALTGVVWTAAFILLTSLYPSQWLPTDGSKLWKLLWNDARTDRLRAQTQIGSAVLRGVRPRDWEPAWIETALARKDGSASEANAHYLAYRWALDTKAMVRAEQHLAQAVRLRFKLSPADRLLILIEAAFFELRFNANAANADAWLKKLGSQQRQTHPIPRLRLACAANLMLKKYDHVRQIAHAAIAVLDKAKAQDGVSLAERDLFHDMIVLSDAAAASAQDAPAATAV